MFQAGNQRGSDLARAWALQCALPAGDGMHGGEHRQPVLCVLHGTRCGCRRGRCEATATHRMPSNDRCESWTAFAA
eukprot:7044168-Pyramimonas_sp.AAC.1